MQNLYHLHSFPSFFLLLLLATLRSRRKMWVTGQRWFSRGITFESQSRRGVRLGQPARRAGKDSRRRPGRGGGGGSKFAGICIQDCGTTIFPGFTRPESLGAADFGRTRRPMQHIARVQWNPPKDEEGDAFIPLGEALKHIGRSTAGPSAYLMPRSRGSTQRVCVRARDNTYREILW